MSKGLLTTVTPLDCRAMPTVSGFELTYTQPTNTDIRVVFSDNIAIKGVRTYPVSTNAVVADTVAINGVIFTAVAGGATGNQFNVGTTTTLTATNLAATLNASTTINALYMATTSTNVVTLTEKTAAGNTPGAATKTGTIVIDTGTVTTSAPKGVYYKTSGMGVVTLIPIATQALTVDSVLVEGNTITEAQAATSIPDFAGKLISPAIALYAAPNATAMPMIKIGIKGFNGQDQYTKEILSEEYIFADKPVRVFNFTANPTTENGGTVTVLVSLKNENDIWSDWITLTQANENKVAKGVKFKVIFSATQLGVSLAKLGYVSFAYMSGLSFTSDMADVITVTKDFGDKIRQAKVIVKHQRLQDAVISASAGTKKPPQKATNEYLGLGTGEYQSFVLSHPVGVVPGSVQVYFNSSSATSFDYNTTTGSVGCVAPNGVSISANYEYGLEAETWEALIKGETLAGITEDTTEYYVTLPTESAKAISLFRTRMEKREGTVTAENLGVSSGFTQRFILNHYAKQSTVIIHAGDSLVPNANWNYEPINKMLTVVAPIGKQLTADYNWSSEQPVINSIIALCSD